MAAYDLSNYDGVLAYGNVIRDIYLSEGWTQHAWTWHEAADTRLFHPIDATCNEEENLTPPQSSASLQGKGGNSPLSLQERGWGRGQNRWVTWYGLVTGEMTNARLSYTNF
jgi:hypothetical protein